MSGVSFQKELSTFRQMLPKKTFNLPFYLKKQNIFKDFLLILMINFYILLKIDIMLECNITVQKSSQILKGHWVIYFLYWHLSTNTIETLTPHPPVSL